MGPSGAPRESHPIYKRFCTDARGRGGGVISFILSRAYNPPGGWPSSLCATSLYSQADATMMTSRGFREKSPVGDTIGITLGAFQ